MDFGFSEEQELLRQEVRKLLDAQAPLEQVRKHAETPEGFSRELWKQIAMLGWVLTFLIIALIAAVLGFGGIAGFAIEIAKIIFFVAIVLFVISAIFALIRGRSPTVP